MVPGRMVPGQKVPGLAFHSRLTLGEDLAALGIATGDMVMVHAAMRRVGPLLNGPDALIAALLDRVGPSCARHGMFVPSGTS